MTQFLKQSTQVKVVVGPAVEVANGYVPVTTLTLSGADEAELIKHDAGSVTDISAATIAAITGADGYYNITLTTAHTDTVGMLTLLINDDSLILPLRHTYMVLPANVYDSLVAGTDTLESDVIQWLGTAVATPTVAGVPEVDTTHFDGNAGAGQIILDQADTALVNNHLDHLFAVDYDPAAKPGVATALLNELIEDDAGVSRYTANALEQGPLGNNLSAAEVNTEVSDVLKTDTIAERAQQAPPATPTFEEAMMYLYMALRNKIDVTATLKEFHNDAGTVIWKKSLSDDGTTYSEAEGVTGP